jgi:hypothetical protein
MSCVCESLRINRFRIFVYVPKQTSSSEQQYYHMHSKCVTIKPQAKLLTKVCVSCAAIYQPRL